VVEVENHIVIGIKLGHWYPHVLLCHEPHPADAELKSVLASPAPMCHEDAFDLPMLAALVDSDPSEWLT
jgi:hypothetical protein